MNQASLGRRVRQRRQELGLDQEELAEKIGRTRGYVSRLEAGKSGEGVSDLLAIARVLGMRLSELVGETDEEMVAEIRRQLPNGTELALSFERLARGVAGQSEAEQAFIRGFLDHLAARYGPAEPEQVNEA